MTPPPAVPKLKMVSRVTRRHGRIFAKLLIASVTQTEIPGEVFSASGIMEPPEELDTPAYWRHEWIEGEIMVRVFNEIEDRLCDTFMAIADEVIQRERQRQRQRQGE
ncbi:MAG: hypothetical protein M3P06_23460 [Acidobacteriota bacterium]|nr:hypothetical protein [Acidobacteriota bacterium]